VIDGKIYRTASASAYLALMNPVCEISVVDAEGNTVAATPYSMAAYIISMEAAGYDVEIVKALYTFAKATLDLRNSIFN